MEEGDCDEYGNENCVMSKKKYDELQQFEIQSPQVQFLDEKRAEISFFYWKTLNELVVESIRVTFVKNKHVEINEEGSVKMFDFGCVGSF
jgi:hypothetical protein